MAAGYQDEWSGVHVGFQQFLDWLDEGVDSGGEKYLEMRRRLTRYFDRKNCRMPDELADETLSRVARRLGEEGAITDASPAHYCYIVARFVFLEYRRRPEQRQVSLDTLPEFGSGGLRVPPSSEPGPVADVRRKLLECLESCVQKLPSTQRDLIFEYYRCDQRAKIECRRRLAERFELTMNALSIRACRIRQRLEACIRSCERE